MNYRGGKCHLHFWTLLKPDQDSVVHFPLDLLAPLSAMQDLCAQGTPTSPARLQFVPSEGTMGTVPQLLPEPLGPLILSNPPKRLYLQSHPVSAMSER